LGVWWCCAWRSAVTRYQLAGIAFVAFFLLAFGLFFFGVFG
jgi:hypothetical protein